MDIIEKNDEHNVQLLYHPFKKLEDPRSTTSLSDLLHCDAIIISSPNSTHFDYIKKLDSFSGYIFCEKPPAISYDELEQLKNLPNSKKEKTFFNFNFRFSKLNETIHHYLNSEFLGDILFIQIIMSQGLAFKNEYKNSWRSDGHKNKFNLLDTLSIHFLDLILNNLGSFKNKIYFPKLIAETGTSYDFGHLILDFDKVNVSILNSYVTPYVSNLTMLGTNGILTIQDNILEVNSPRDTFDDDHFFKSPPVQNSLVFDMQKDYSDSLTNSLEYFLFHVKNKKYFDIHNFDTSLKTTKLILDLKNGF